MEPEEQFLFDDFFVAEDDPGVEVRVTIRGRSVPIMVRRGLTLDEREGALSAALHSHVGPDGRLVVDGLDTKRATEELLMRSIVSWPFVYRNGDPVPINRATLGRFLADGVDQLAGVIKGLFAAKQEVADGPFEQG